MHQCVNVTICNFAIFMKFSPNCRTKEFGILFSVLGGFAHFLIGKRSMFSPKIGIGKSLDLSVPINRS